MNKNTLVASAAVVAGLVLGVQTVSADTYTVQAGDTVSEIALAHDTTVTAIANLNSLDNQNLIYIGDQLKIGNSAVYQPTTAPVKVPAEQPKVQQEQPTQQAPKVTQQVPQAQAQRTQPATPKQIDRPQQSPQGYVMTKTSGQLSQSEINQVANEMASRTGQSSSTWSTIINRESKGNVNISNSEGSGAYGLLQLMRSSHGSVSSQVDEAVQLYKAQGMGAWSQTAY